MISKENSRETGEETINPTVPVDANPEATREHTDEDQKDRARFQTEAERKRRIALINEQVRGLKLTADQKDVLSEIEKNIMYLENGFLESVGNMFRYDWDPGSGWEIKKGEDGRERIVKVEFDNPDAPHGGKHHLFREGQELRIHSGVVPDDVIVRECVGKDLYKVQSKMNGKVFIVGEDHLFDPSRENSLFEDDLAVTEMNQDVSQLFG